MSNPGNNIDLIQANSIIITPNDAANTITIGENHSGLTNNPHNTTASVGALATAYDLRQRAFATATFTQANATGATQTLAFTFQPRLVLVTGLVEANLGAGPMVAVSPVSLLSTRPGLSPSAARIRRDQGCRWPPTDWFSRAFASNSTLFTTDITDTPAAQRGKRLVAITSLTATGFIVTFTRTPIGAALCFSVTLHCGG